VVAAPQDGEGDQGGGEQQYGAQPQAERVPGGEGSAVELRQAGAAEPEVRDFLVRQGSAVVARRGELVDALARPAVVAIESGVVSGVLTYDVVGESCEILTLHAGRQWAGLGTAMVVAVAGLATAAGCRRYWVVTTNDNVDALRFYQRRGFRLTALRPGAVDQSRRTVKPQIPPTGNYGIPLRDEIELAQDLPLPSTS
jgi:GNAT superfamily N-acetyltransferase